MSDSTITSLGLFTGEEHKRFFWEGGKPAALLVHGFLGTPAEMRPLARELHRAGWTVEGLLLPGFGEQIGTLFERRYDDWLEAVRLALRELQRSHEPLLLIGFSLGGALALNVAAEEVPDGLILLAPFWRLGNRLHHIIWRAMKVIFPRLRPFKRANFSDPRLKRFFGGVAPELDLADPQIQEALKEISFPSRFIDQILAACKNTKQSSRNLVVPTLIIQGTQDEAVKPASTRQLLQRLPGPISYEELEADHSLVEADNPGYQQVAQSVLAFAARTAADDQMEE